VVVTGVTARTGNEYYAGSKKQASIILI